MKIEVAVIGCGSIAEFRHAPEYQANPDAEIIAFCDPAPGRAVRLTQMFGGRAFMNYEEVLALPGLDAVSVCTSNATHAEVTVNALRAGKHVLCEKPMATTLSEARQMIREAQRAGRNLMPGHNQRFAPAHTKARELIRSGQLGRVLSFRTAFGHGGPEGWSADKGAGTWFFRKSAAALGALGDLGVHKADLVRFLLGDEIDEVYAVATTMHKTYESGAPIDVEDNALCILKMRSGAAGTMAASWTYYGAEDNSTVLHCEKGILKVYASPEKPLLLERPGGAAEEFEAGAIQTNAGQTASGVIDAFVGSIVRGAPPPVTGEDGYEALSVALACGLSARTGDAARVRHYADGAEGPFSLPRRMHVAYAVHNLRMETNLVPERLPERPGYRYCEETYPLEPVRRSAHMPEGKLQHRLDMELGGNTFS